MKRLRKATVPLAVLAVALILGIPSISTSAFSPATTQAPQDGTYACPSGPSGPPVNQSVTCYWSLVVTSDGKQRSTVSSDTIYYYTWTYSWWATNIFGQILYKLVIQQTWSGDGTNILGWSPTIANDGQTCCGWEPNGNAWTSGPTWFLQPTEASAAAGAQWYHYFCLTSCIIDGEETYSTNIYFTGNGQASTSPI